MHAQETTFSKLVHGEVQFQVPLYQRTYTWQRDELRQLWDDVQELVEDRSEGAAPAAHFLGSVVLAPERVAAGGMQRWLVVDGQQRLTTLMLAFTALRDRHRALGRDQKADRIHDLILVNRYQEGKDHYRLLPTQADRDAFVACVESLPTAGGPGNVGGAYRFFHAALTVGEESGGEEWVGAVESVLRDFLSIVSITAAEGDNVYRIFESINNTGVGLSQSDLLRNYLFMCLPKRGEAVYRNLWLPMQELLGPARLELLVWLDLVVGGDRRAKQSDIYRDQKRRLEPLSSDEKALEAEIARLNVRAARLMRIVEPHREHHAGLREVLERLFRWGGQTHYPLALLVLDRLDAGDCAPEEAATAMAYAESYMVRRLFAGSSTTGNNRTFMELPKEVERELEAGRRLPDAVRRVLSAKTGTRLWPSDAVVREAIRDRPFYKSGRAGQRFEILRRFEEGYGASEPVDFAKANLTVEHVLPQRPAQQWFDLLAEEAGETESPEELHGRLIHTLGNLTLSGDNARLSNHPFHRKQQILDSSALRMNQRIADQHRWGRAEILSRSAELADLAVKLWPGPVDGPVDAYTDAEWTGWAELRQALLTMPAGTWTTYGDLAALIGTSAMGVGSHVSARPTLHGAYRVLLADGKVSPGFRPPAGREGFPGPREALESEGVPFDEGGRARRSHRLTAADLAALVGKDDHQREAPARHTDTDDGQTAAHRFEALLRGNQTPHTAEGVLASLRFWEGLGGTLRYGRKPETSCFPTLRQGSDPARSLWPFGLYPVSGTVEVAFEHLKRRPPFDDELSRREQMARLNRVDGIDLAEAKLDLRPSFPLEVFAEHGEEIRGVLEWFAHTVAHADARAPLPDTAGRA
ncbi:GmrSD restriction endonuclease domain-containing protein [Streptomyces sp. WMMC905]|uniref:GmrSD restriction endonuclease domain-containing protein n=1 Tax=Streptomyces sp. WMMC905 TaxID=3404123 RepID=UPI003B9588BE